MDNDLRRHHVPTQEALRLTPVHPELVCACLLPQPNRNAFGWSVCLICELWIQCRICNSLVHSSFDCMFKRVISTDGVSVQSVPAQETMR